MLVLMRKEGEKIRIGNDVILTVTSITRGQVKIGIAAPREIEVHREEIFDLIHNQGSK